MKAFIFGTRQMNEGEEKWQLSESISSHLDELMSNETEILLDDQGGAVRLVQEYLSSAKYKPVTVCVAGSKNWRLNNAGNWPEKNYVVHGESRGYLYGIEKEFGMAEEADCGLAIWDGEDFCTFTNVLCLCALGKACKLYLIKEDNWIDVNSIEDLRAYKGQDKDFSNGDYFKILNLCGFSEEMIEFIVSEDVVSPFVLVDIVCQAPISLTNKKAHLDFLAREKNLKHRAYCSVEENLTAEKPFKVIKHDIRAIVDPNRSGYFKNDSIWAYIRDRQKALKEASEQIFPPKLTGLTYSFGKKMISFEQAGSGIDGLAHCDKPLYLFGEWYDTDDLQHKEYPIGYVTDPGMAEYHIKNEESENDTGEGFYRLEARNYDDPEWKKTRFDYYYDCKGNLCWFEKLSTIRSGPDDTWYCPEDHFFSSGFTDLSIRTPYKPGDIVLIDCRPFAPLFHAMILEAKDQFDCCFPNIVFRVPGTDKWRLTPLKHRRFFEDLGFVYEPMLSPLYRLRKVMDGELSEDDKELIEFSKMIAGSEEKSSEVWNRWGGYDLSLENVKQLFDNA